MSIRPLMFLAVCGLVAGQNVITTIAGIDAVFNGDGMPALSVPLGYLNGVATDAAGNVYFTDPLEHLLLSVSPDGVLSVIAGNGVAGYSGDGGPATSAAIAASDSPDQYVGRLFQDSLGGIVVDKLGNLYFADGHYVRRVDTNGIITTVAGGGTLVPGEGKPATQVALGNVNGIALDSAGNLYFSETNRIRKVTPGGILTTFAGMGPNGFSGDGGPATSALLAQPLGLAFDAQGNLFFADGSNAGNASRIRRIAANGTITTFAGGGTALPADGAAPLSMDLTGASGLAVDSLGAVYIYSPLYGYLLKISGGRCTLITSVFPGDFTDNVPARNAYVAGQRPFDNSGIALDAAGNLYVADNRNGRLRKIDTKGNLTTLAGTGAYGFSGDGGPALGALLQNPTSITQTPNGTIYFLDAQNVRVRSISPNGMINTVLASSIFPNVDSLDGIVSDPSGNVYVLLGKRLVELTSTGKILVLLNQAALSADSGDGGPATDAAIQLGGGLTRDTAGNLYLSDSNSNRIRKITADGKIQTIAGTGKLGISPDGAVAATSRISEPTSVLADNLGGLYFEESPSDSVGSAVIRYITPDGKLKTIAGNGSGGFAGDGGPATVAGLMMQKRTGMALDKLGNLYLADGFNNRIRMISPAGIISTVIGDGTDASAGDGGLAKNASLFTPRGLYFNSAGDLLISDVSANRIRAVLAAPPAVSVTPAQISFSAAAGGVQTPPQKLMIESPVSGLFFNVTKSSGADWLVLGSAGGFTPRLINVRADPANLTAGTYKATITISTRFGNPATRTVAVTFQVAPGGAPKLSVGSSAFSFTFPSNSTSSKTSVTQLRNAGTGTLLLSTRAQTFLGGNWLSASPASSSVTPQTPANLAVTANPAGLAVGTYRGIVTISSSNTTETATIRVTLTVSSLDQAIQLSQTGLSFTAVAGGGVVAPRSVVVGNIGRGSMNFTIATRTISGGAWLSATPHSGTAITGSTRPPVTVNVNQTGLAPGTYYGLVRVDAPGAANSPRLVTVVLRVLSSDQDPGPVIEPSEIVFTATQGAPSPGAKVLRVYNVSASPQTYGSSITAADANNLFDFVPDNATLSLAQPTRLIVQPLTSGLAAGVYDSELTLQFSDGFVRRVGIRTVVTPAAPGSSSSSKAEDAAVGCTASQLVPAITTLGQSFGVPAAWPVSLEADVLDDCGNSLTSGNVIVAFSNGDPPLRMESSNNGSWTTTWSSGNNLGPVTLTVTANDPARNLVGTREVTGGLGNPAPAPVLNAAVSGASFEASNPLAPGSIISLFGQNLANGTSSANALPLSTTLAGASVLIAGNEIPLIYGSTGQINAVVPLGININTNHQVVVQRDNTLSIPVPVDIGPDEPAIFGYPAQGDPATQGAIVNAVTYAVAHPASPVTAGDVLTIFCTGLGVVDAKVADGAAAPASPLANTIATPTVTIGGQSTQVTFSGLAPGFVGLYQVNVVVPRGIATGSQVPVVLSILGDASPPQTIAVK